MKITPDIWHQVNLIHRELKRRGEDLTRKKISDALQVNDNTAKFLLYAIENTDILNLRLDVIKTDGDKELIISDIHVPFHDRQSLELAFSYAEQKGATIITILGDLLDFYKISRFTKVPTNKGVSQEIQEANNFLNEIRARFPKARIIYYLGNHELRLEKYICENAGEIYDLISDLLPIKLGLKEKNIEYRVKPFKIGSLWHLHGHEKPPGGNPSYVCNVMWKYIHDNFIVGHFHRTQEQIFSHIDGVQKYIGLAVGAMANLKSLEYAIINQWNNGFCFVEYDSKGNFKVHNRKILLGEIF